MTAVPRPRPFVEELVTYRPGRSAEGLTKLSSNESSAPPHPAVIEAVDAAARRLNTYPLHGNEAVRVAVAQYLRATDPAAAGLDEHAVVVGNGSVSLLRHVFDTYVGEGDAVVTPWPSFEAYPIFSQITQARFVGVPDRSGVVDMAGLLRAVADHDPRLILLATPNNPTGAQVDHADMLAVLDACGPETVVVVDNAYAEFERNVDGTRALELLEAHPNVLVLRTLSKAFSLAGLRVGYGIGHPELVDAVERMRSPFEVSALAQAGAVAGLAHYPDALATVAQVVDERTRCLDVLRGTGLPVGESQGNFVWIDAGNLSGLFTGRLWDDGYVVREFPGEGVRVTVVADPGVNDGWVTSVAATWQLAELAGARDSVAPATAASRPRSSDSGLQKSTYGAAALLAGSVETVGA